MIPGPKPRRKRDSTIAMINVVFLMLIFFLIAGTIASPIDPELRLVNTSDLKGREPPDALVLDAKGVLSFRGMVIEPGAYMATHDKDAVRIVPDRNVPASRLVEVTGALRMLGASSVFVVTEQAAR